MLDPAEAVLDLKVLDPAMGSGHFLVTAVDFCRTASPSWWSRCPRSPNGWTESTGRL